MSDGGGISSRLVDGMGVIVLPSWQRAAETKALVGRCRMPKGRGTTCEGFLVALPVEVVAKVTWFEAECLACGHTYASAHGKVLPRSSRRSEMPDGAWESRQAAWANLFGKVKEAA